MKKVLTLFLPFLLLFTSFSILVKPIFAQKSEETLAQDVWTDSDAWDIEESNWWDTEGMTLQGTDLENSDLGILGGLLTGITALFVGGVLLFTVIVGLASYIFSAIALMGIAKKLDYENGWFAWIPILNIVLILKMGDMNPLLVLLILIPGVGSLIITIIMVIAMMNISEKRGYEKMLGLLTLVPIANFVLFGILAWSKREA